MMIKHENEIWKILMNYFALVYNLPAWRMNIMNESWILLSTVLRSRQSGPRRVGGGRWIEKGEDGEIMNRKGIFYSLYSQEILKGGGGSWSSIEIGELYIQLIYL